MKSLASQVLTACCVNFGRYENDWSRVGATSHKWPAPSRLRANIITANGKFLGCVVYAPLFQVGSAVIASAGKKSCIPRRPALGNGEEINGTTPRMASGYCTAHCHAWRPPYEMPMTATSSRTSSASVRSRLWAWTTSSSRYFGKPIRSPSLGLLDLPVPMLSEAITKYFPVSSGCPGPNMLAAHQLAKL